MHFLFLTTDSSQCVMSVVCSLTDFSVYKVKFSRWERVDWKVWYIRKQEKGIY